MALTMASTLELLQEHDQLREVIQGDRWTLDSPEDIQPSRPFTDVTYDTRQAGPGSLLFCKGHFRPEYLDSCGPKGPAAYVAQQDLSAHTKAPGIIVNDVRKSMSLLASAFYGRPQDRLTLVGITGTKGKTTTAYFLQAMLSRLSGGRAALLSSVDNCLDGRHYQESQLTTPESLDLFRMMRHAVDAGMRYMVMEVSSQAYKVDRVYGLTFDLGAFLNISPDHISPIEHPSFEDYFYCKRRITYNSRQLVLGADTRGADLIRQDARAAGVPVTTFGDGTRQADFLVRKAPGEGDDYLIGPSDGALRPVSLSMDGDFNALNAAAALAMLTRLGLEPDSGAIQAMGNVRIAGRMERFKADNRVVYVDYAHNKASVTALLNFVDERYGERKPLITLVSGSAGGKAIDRREGIVSAAQDRVDRLILTADDEDGESSDQVDQQMLGFVTNPNLDVSIEPDRAQAIKQAVGDPGRPGDRLRVTLVIGKGEERWIKKDGSHVPYEGDDHVVARLLGTKSYNLGATGTAQG